MKDDDSVWKDVLDRYFEDFLRFFFPRVHRDVDWSRRYEFLDKEFQRIVRGGPSGRRYADKLVKVHLHEDEGEAWLLLHVEVEERGGPRFAERVYIYNHRIFERYGRQVISLAVLTDPGRRSVAESFERRRWGFQLTFRFPVVCFADYRGREESLARERNPFALLVLAHLRRRQAGSAESTLSLKKSLVEELYRRKYSRGDIIQLFLFLDWLLSLPPELEERFHGWLEEYEEERAMPYISSIERIGIRKGLEQGLHQAIEVTLRHRFGEESVALIERLETVRDVEALRGFHRGLLEAAGLREVEALLDEIGGGGAPAR